MVQSNVSGGKPNTFAIIAPRQFPWIASTVLLTSAGGGFFTGSCATAIAGHSASKKRTCLNMRHLLGNLTIADMACQIPDVLEWILNRANSISIRLIRRRVHRDHIRSLNCARIPGVNIVNVKHEMHRSGLPLTV